MWTQYLRGIYGKVLGSFVNKNEATQIYKTRHSRLVLYPRCYLLAWANVFWPTAVFGEADCVSSVSSGVSPGQKALLHGTCSQQNHPGSSFKSSTRKSPSIHLFYVTIEHTNRWGKLLTFYTNFCRFCNRHSHI